jgi:transposase
MPGPQSKYGIQLSDMQATELTHLSMSYTKPYAEVQRAKILLLAHQPVKWSNGQIAEKVGCTLNTVKTCRKRWHGQGSLHSQPRPGKPRQFSALVRAQIIALACSNPADHGKVWKRWSGEKLARVAVEKGIVCSISASTIREWLREDKIKPWRYHSWQEPSDPQFVEKAAPVLELYEHAKELSKQGEAVVCIDEKTSIQARQRVSETQAAIPGHPVQVSDRYKRMGSLQLFCTLMVATGFTLAECYARKCFSDFKNFLLKLFERALCQGLKGLHLILDNGPTHAPKQLENWITSLNLSFKVTVYWLPKHASWLDQVEIIFSKVQRDLLTPNDFPSLLALQRDLLAYFNELNQHPKPIQWTYTKEKLIAKFGSPEPKQLAA